MTRTIGFAMIVIGAGWWTLAAGAAEPSSQPSTQPSTQPGRQFNSKVSFRVFALIEEGQPILIVGVTPGQRPLAIPACRSWWVEPGKQGERLAQARDWTPLQADMAAVAGEVNVQGIPGLRLPAASDDDLAHLKDLTGLQMLDLAGTKVTDAGMAHLKDLTGLQMLDLAGTKVTDAGMAHLKNLTGLQTLNLAGTTVTDTGLAHLKNSTGLQTLDLVGTRVAGASLVHLKYLKTLNLSATNMTDAGLVYMKDFKELRYLYVVATSVTSAGIAELKISLPNLMVFAPCQDIESDAYLKRELARTLREVDFADTELRQVLESLTGRSNTSVVLDPELAKDLDKKISLTWKEGRTVAQALSLSLKQVGANWRQQEGVVYIFKKAPLLADPMGKVSKDAPEWERDIRRRLQVRIPRMQLPNVPMGDFLKFIRCVSYVNIVVDPKVDAKTQVNIQVCYDLTIHQILNLCCQMYGLTYKLADGAIYVSEAPTASSSPSATPEIRAAAKMKLVESYRANGKNIAARKILEEIVKDFPDTSAAEQARKDLQDLPTSDAPPTGR